MVVAPVGQLPGEVEGVAGEKSLLRREIVPVGDGGEVAVPSGRVHEPEVILRQGGQGLLALRLPETVAAQIDILVGRKEVDRVGGGVHPVGLVGEGEGAAIGGDAVKAAAGRVLRVVVEDGGQGHIAVGVVPPASLGQGVLVQLGIEVARGVGDGLREAEGAGDIGEETAQGGVHIDDLSLLLVLVPVVQYRPAGAGPLGRPKAPHRGKGVRDIVPQIEEGELPLRVQIGVLRHQGGEGVPEGQGPLGQIGLHQGDGEAGGGGAEAHRAGGQVGADLGHGPLSLEEVTEPERCAVELNGEGLGEGEVPLLQTQGGGGQTEDGLGDLILRQFGGVGLLRRSGAAGHQGPGAEGQGRRQNGQGPAPFGGGAQQVPEAGTEQAFAALQLGGEPGVGTVHGSLLAQMSSTSPRDRVQGPAASVTEK